MGKECKNCYGKGYFTEFKGNTIAHADFIGDKSYITDKARIIIGLCNCERGKDLEKYFNIKKKFKP